MVKAMYAGVAGLKAHQSKMDVISNNIANVNTWGYKSMNTSFKESIYQTMTGGTSGTTGDGGMGGTNPAMVGYGSMVSSISSNFTTGTQVPTGRALDVFIDGTAFFAVGPMYGTGDSKSPGDLSLSRVGDLGVINNYLVDGNGRYVYGFSMSTGGEIYNPKTVTETTREENVLIPAGEKNVPKDPPVVTRGGVTTEIKYRAHVPNTGWMTVTTKVTQTKSADEYLSGITVPSSDSDILTAIKNANEILNGITYTSHSTDPRKVILTSGTDLTSINAVLPVGFKVPDDTSDDKLAGVMTKMAADATTAAAAADGDKSVYEVKDGKVVRTVDACSGTGTGLAGLEKGSDLAAINAALSKINNDSDNKAKNIEYSMDPAFPGNIYKIRQVVTTPVEKEIPLPEADKYENADGTTTIISYEGNGKKNGTATKVTSTTYPVDPDAEKKGPIFDDGRMSMNEDGKYIMADGVGTLKPLKLPTTCTYYDENGVEQIEENINFGTFHIESDGMLYGTSTVTKRTYLLGAIALVNVPNPSGMAKSDGPYHTPGGSSGAPKILAPGSSAGKLKSEFLESANVDIATEFSEMITTQRGFQANSKIITVTDEMLQELVNMKR